MSPWSPRSDETSSASFRGRREAGSSREGAGNTAHNQSTQLQGRHEGARWGTCPACRSHEDELSPCLHGGQVRSVLHVPEKLHVEPAPTRPALHQVPHHQECHQAQRRGGDGGDVARARLADGEDVWDGAWGGVGWGNASRPRSAPQCTPLRGWQGRHR